MFIWNYSIKNSFPDGIFYNSNLFSGFDSKSCYNLTSINRRLKISYSIFFFNLFELIPDKFEIFKMFCFFCFIF